MSGSKLKFSSVLLMGVNFLVGAGIYLTPAKAFHNVGIHVFWLLAVCAILAIFIALVFAEMAGIFTRTGGIYVYVSEAFGPVWGFQVGFMRFVASALALGVQMTALPPMIHIDTGGQAAAVSIAFLAVLTGINLVSVKVADMFVKFTSFLVLASLIFTIVVGFFGINPDNFNLPVVHLDSSNFSSGFLLLFYAFVGFENIGVAAQDMENPKRDVPRAIITVLILVTIIYFFLFASTLGTLGEGMWDEAKFNPNSAAATVGVVLGKGGESIMLAGAFIALTGIGLAMSFAGPRNLVPIAADSFLPESISANNSRGVPAKSIIIMFLTTVPFILIANFTSKDAFSTLAKVATIARLIQYISVCVGLFNVRKKHGEGTFKLPVAGFFVFSATLVCLILFTTVKKESIIYTAGLIGVTVLTYVLYAGPRRKKSLGL